MVEDVFVVVVVGVVVVVVVVVGKEEGSNRKLVNNNSGYRLCCGLRLRSSLLLLRHGIFKKFTRVDVAPCTGAFFGELTSLQDSHINGFNVTSIRRISARPPIRRSRSRLQERGRARLASRSL
jgi:hypothetical protein